MLFAMPFGIDGTCGDSIWVPDTIYATELDTFATLAKTLMDEKGYSEEDLEDLVGFWIINAKTKTDIEEADNTDEFPVCDSEIYKHIHALKEMAKNQAVKTILKA
jgi:hypothetical protein